MLELIGWVEDQGASIIVVSHNLECLKDVVDRIVVLHHGYIVGDSRARNVTRDILLDRMVGGKPSEA